MARSARAARRHRHSATCATAAPYTGPMEHDRSTLQPSEVSTRSTSDAERTPGLMRLFSAGTPMAVAVPLRGGELEVGRGSVSAGEAQDPRMSRRHAQVRFDGRRFLVTDLGSQNGTSVDGEPLPAGA